MKVTATISTRGRSGTTLPLALQAVAFQTRLPDELVLFDDNDEREDLRARPPYDHLFRLFADVGLKWRVVFGERQGQLLNHQVALDHAETPLIWRLDDDEAPEPTCLARLLEEMQDGVGAVGGLVMIPGMQHTPTVQGKISEIYENGNLQWGHWDGPARDVEHLTSSFLYRVEAGRKVGGYPKNLSPVAHREETIFTHEIFRAGFRLRVTPRAVTWHYRTDGGIRTRPDPALWDHDEEIFKQRLAAWKTPSDHYWIVLDCGLGDHIVFRSVLEGIRAQHPGKKLVIACCYPEIFEHDRDVTLTSIAEASAKFGALDRFSVYKFGEDRNWTRPLAEAFLELYR